MKPVCSSSHLVSKPGMMLVFTCLAFLISSCTGRSAALDRAPALAWTYDSGSPLNYSPVLLEDLVLVTPVQGPLLAIDLESGKLRWSYQPPEGIWDGTVAAFGQFVFIAVRGGRLVALHARDGSLLWESRLGIETQAPPLVTASALFVPTTFVGPGLDNNPHGKAVLFALDPQTGTVLWSFQSQNYILQTPSACNGRLYIGGSTYLPEIEVEEGGPMRIDALSADNGELLWSYSALDGYVKAIYADRQVVAYIAYQDFLVGLDALTGALKWRKDTGNWVPSLLGSGSQVYFGSANTKVSAHNMDDGSSLWEYDIPAGAFNYLLGAPVRLDDHLVFLTQHGEITAIQAQDGALIWSLPAQVRSRAGLAAGNGWFLIGDEFGKIYAYH